MRTTASPKRQERRAEIFPLFQRGTVRLRAKGKWGRSSAGRASQWHCEGQGFDPPRLHHPSFSAKRTGSRSLRSLACTHRRPQRRVADAIVEADPVDAMGAAAGIAVAELDSPLRRTTFRDIVQRASHRSTLPRHAACLPLANYPDVERNGVMKHRPRPGEREWSYQHRCGRGRQKPFHRRINDTVARACRNHPNRGAQKENGGALGATASLVQPAD